MRGRRAKRIGILVLLVLALSVSLYLWTKETLTLVAWSIVGIYTLWGAFHTTYFIAGRKPPYSPSRPALRKLKFSLIVPARNEPLIERT
ncbi:MAG: hypothetical protein N3H32_05670, partial [Nitrososphaeria archaeon]|nr:hypothetical protein [Nitrososphaeria archaeon]